MGERGPKQQFTDVSCPNTDCKKYGRIDGGNIIGNGTYETSAGTVRKFICKECGQVFNSRTGTAYEGIRSPQDKFDLVIKCLNEGMGVRATARTAGCSVNTVKKWTSRSGHQAKGVMERMEHGLKPKGIQFDEMSGILKKN